MEAIGGQRLGPDGGCLDGRGKTGRRRHDRQEARLLGDRFEKERTGRGETVAIGRPGNPPPEPRSMNRSMPRSRRTAAPLRLSTTCAVATAAGSRMPSG
jgi:hypothetical protein